MPILEALQTFAGITNENEFYSHHYLAEVFKGDIKVRLEQWEAQETAHPGEDDFRAPSKRLQSVAQKWFGLRSQVQRGSGAAERWELFTQMQTALLQALGYPAAATDAALHEFNAGMPVPVWSLLGQRLAVIPAYQPGAEADELLDHELTQLHYGQEPLPKDVQGLSWAELLSEAVFGGEQPPRYVVLAGLDQWLLLDRYKWPNNRALRFDWAEILDRKAPDTLKACAALLHRESLAPGEGNSLLESLDENAHKHAFGVSEDLKYALREAIEILGNEAARQLEELATGSKKSIYSGQYKLDASELSLECLRMVYRLLFMFYIEARPELGYVPIQKSEVYLKGYSLESLRDLELQQLPTPQSREGKYFDMTLRRLFRLVAQGCGLGGEQGDLKETTAGAKDTFALAPLDSRLFDDNTLPLLSKVQFPNEVWQRVIKLMSQTKPRKKGERPGRVSYQLLSINQLGAVYEALLSYRGFFAQEDLYEVKPAPKKAKVASEDDEDEEGDDDSGETTTRAGRGGGDSGSDMLENAWFVPRSRIDEYNDNEKVYDVNEAGHRKLRMHPKGRFIYRLAGRDREKSASYYTPQVLTQCLVKYALKELLAPENGRVKCADDILSLSVCEPAMGSAAFLNEAVNQLAEAYLERKQAELKARIPHEQYPQELQRVRMYLADRNVYGVDLNPVAVELAEVSIWLNAIYGEEDEHGMPLPARVPWFGYQLFSGNSLIGARYQVYRASSLLKGAKPAWSEEAPRRVTKDQPRQTDEIWHFLLPDPGMSAYKDKEAKRLYADDFDRLRDWRKAFCAPLAKHEIARLRQLSARVEELWDQHTTDLARDRALTEDALSVWPHSDADEAKRVPRAQKEAIRKKGLLNEDGDLATPFRRLKLVMDYWCALWFWPITDSTRLPSRDEWLMEVGAILEGNVVELAVQRGLDLLPTEPEAPQVVVPEVQGSLDGFDSQMPLTQAPGDYNQPNLHDRLGQLRISKLRQHFPRVPVVEAVAERRRFLHWELCFADVLLKRGGFDLILGNPPWLKVEWNEAGILGERNPVFAIRKVSASELAKLRMKTFERFPGLVDDWTGELEEAEGTQGFLNAVQNYPLLKGVQTNLYKCFMPLTWGLNSNLGVTGLLHMEGPFDDPKGGRLRETVYARLRRHFQFTNVKSLFQDVMIWKRYSVNIYGKINANPAFDNISNLFVPRSVDLCYEHDGSGLPGGIKDDGGQWNISGHRDRIVRVDEKALAIFRQLYDEPGTPACRARLPALHLGALSSVLYKLASYPSRLANLGEEYFSSEMWNETDQQKDGTISRRLDTDVNFPKSPGEWVVSGPHFYVANPFYKTPRKKCNTPRAYDSVDLQFISEDYLPRTNYWPKNDLQDYFSRAPQVHWVNDGEKTPRPVTDYFRNIHRRALSMSGERTVNAALIPPEVGHIDGVFSIAFRHIRDLIAYSSAMSSLPIDFYIKSTGKADLRRDLADKLPLISVGPEVTSRYLALNCLTSHYTLLWEQAYRLEFADQQWAQPDNPRLPHNFWVDLTGTWSRHCALRSDYARRMALVEIDVLVARELGLTFDELILIYRVQFPVLQQNERDTWYDIEGRIVFTCNIGLAAGVGIDRKKGPSTPKTRIQTPDGQVTEGNLAWEDLWTYASADAGDSDEVIKVGGRPKVPDGTVVTQWVTDDTLPAGPHTVERKYVAPFARANREDDYRIAWKFFEQSRKE